MLFLLSPAKTLDYEASALTDVQTLPTFIDHSEVLVNELREKSVDDVRELMSVSEKIAELNVDRFQEWTNKFTTQNSKQAVFAFKGDVYTGLAIETASQEQIDYVQAHVRILSGLYGLLLPLDLMQPYRLEMGTKLVNSRGKNLYEFWGDLITDVLNEMLESDPVLVNLASNEYYKSVKAKKLNATIITPVFKDLKNGQYKIISFYAKKARGLMVRYAADNLIENAADLKQFNYAGYAYNDALSTDTEWVFTRDEAPKS